MKRKYLIMAAVLLLCLAPMPYGYFQLVRLLATLLFGAMAYRYYQERREGLAYACGTLALLFQPFYKIALGRALWNVMDVIVAAGLIILFFVEHRRERRLPDIEPAPIIPDEQPALGARNRIEFQLDSRLAPRELVYVASTEDAALKEFFETNPDFLGTLGLKLGLNLIYLPFLIRRLKNKQVLQYRAPYLSDAELDDINVGNDFMLQYLTHPADKERITQGFIRTESIHRGNDGNDCAVNRFYPLSSASGESVDSQIHNISLQIKAEDLHQQQLLEQHRSMSSSSKSTFRLPDELSDQPMIIRDDDTDELLEEVRERIATLRQRGIAEHILEQLIHPDNRLSRLVVTQDYRILLPDYNNMEIKMEPLMKAVYLFFLRHPEGILFKNLPSYRQELTDIYAKLRPMGLTDKALKSIEDVTNPLQNSINEKCARIKAAFIGQFDEYMAKSYYISGQRGEKKRITLPQHLIVWE
ncbi:MAG: hypothetical protein IJ710_06385 [Prevotella sp.]|nr:hypothetical protein [Prevotella sp.]